MFVQILGSAACGVSPSGTATASNCAGFRDGSLRAKARTHSSIAISDDGVNWVLCNTSPGHPRSFKLRPDVILGRALRDTGISAIILMDSQIDHTTGLLMLREGCRHQVWCTDMVHRRPEQRLSAVHDAQPPEWRADLEPYRLDQSFTVPACPNLRFTPLPLRSAAPPVFPASDSTRIRATTSA